MEENKDRADIWQGITLDGANLKAGKPRFIGVTVNGVEQVMVPKALYDEWVAAQDDALNWADANARWFDISTAPTKGLFLLWDNFNDDYEFGTAIQVAEDEYGRYSHWRPLPPPPSNPPLPAPLEALGAVLRRVKGTT